jgi:hypothetical protein
VAWQGLIAEPQLELPQPQPRANKRNDFRLILSRIIGRIGPQFGEMK